MLFGYYKVYKCNVMKITMKITEEVLEITLKKRKKKK